VYAAAATFSARLGVDMAFPATPLPVHVEIYVDGQWVDITSDVYTREDIVISRGRRDEGTDTDPGSCSFVLNNRDGKYSPRNPRSPYYRKIGRNTPLRISVEWEGRRIPRFFGEISAWPPRWDLSGRDVYVPVEASGVLRRLGAGAEPLRDALYRYLMAQSPRAYWPLTDGPETWWAPCVSGRGGRFIPIVYVGDSARRPQYQEQELAEWLAPVAKVTDAERGVWRGQIYDQGSTSWTVDLIRVGTGGFDSLEIETGGAGTNADPYISWHLGFDHASQELFVTYYTLGATASSVVSIIGGFSDPESFTETPHMYRLAVSQSGNNVIVRVYRDGQLLRSVQDNVPLRPITAVAYNWWVPNDQIATHAGLGHIAVWNGNGPDLGELMSAFRGHAGEAAGRRIERVCAEAGIPFRGIGDLDDTQPVGPQEPTVPLELIQQAAAVDGGVLYEDRESAQLVYRTLRSRYNRGALLEED